MTISPKDIERFEAKVARRGPDDCWLWAGATNGLGYGYLKVNRKTLSAHRLSYEIANGQIPDGGHVCHRCDVRACVNPHHLFISDHAGNMADMVAKDRQCKGEANGASRLREADIIAIRADPRPYVEIGATYGVHGGQISRIKKGAHWKHVPAPTQEPMS